MTLHHHLVQKLAYRVFKETFLRKSGNLTFRGLGEFGRFGNQLWQIFSTIGIAQRNDKKLKLGPWEYSKFFSFPVSLWDTPTALDPNSTMFAKHLGKQSIYLQDLSLLPGDFQWMKDCLQPSDLINDRIEQLSVIYSITERHAVHIRRGDYLFNVDYHTVPSENWIRERLQAESIIFSDDIEWCRSKFPKTEIIDEDEIMSWLLMSRCKKFLISASSYSWWAAYISGSRDVVYPYPWTPQLEKEWDVTLMLPNYFQPNPIAELLN